MHKNVFMLPMSFTESYTKDEPNFPRQNNVTLKKMLSHIDKVVNFNDFSRPSKEIKFFSRTLTKLKDFSIQLLKFKAFSRLNKPWDALPLELQETRGS